MKLLLVILVTLSSLSAIGQSTRQYLDERGKLLTGPEGALYYRQIESKGKVYVVRDFYVSNEQPAMEATCSEVDPQLVYDGPYKTYFKNGQVMEDGLYEDNEKRGLWKTYYENGQQQKETRYEKDKALCLQHWDESGKEHLVNGSGRYLEKNPTIGDQHIEILDYQLIASFSINPVSGDSVYVIVQEPAEYKGGMSALSKMIAKSLRYPPDARRYGIEGKVFVEFVIEKDGSVRDVKVLKGLGGGLNEEAERVIKMANKWSPGKVKGKPVAQKMVFPIAFKLA